MSSPVQVFAASVLLSSGLSLSQNTVRLPPPDKDGWIRLFRGDNVQDWFVSENEDKPPVQTARPFPSAPFSVLGGDTIKSAGRPQGHVFFKQAFSHYRLRYQMHFPENVGNCGLLFHIQENDNPWSGFPVGLESQGDPNQGMGQLWCIGNVWVRLRASKGTSNDDRVTPLKYDPAGRDTVWGAKDGDNRVIEGKDGWKTPSYAVLSKPTGWVTQEVDVHGSDSIAHIVADTVRIKYRDPFVSPGGTPNNFKKKLSRGLLAWQSEGTEVWYRNIEIKLYPEDPLYKTLYPTALGRKAAPARVSASKPVFEKGGMGFPNPSAEAAPYVDALGSALPGYGRSEIKK